LGHIWTTHEEYLSVFIITQYLVAIDAVVLKVLICGAFGLKTPIHSPKIGVFDDLTHQMGSNINQTVKRGILA